MVKTWLSSHRRPTILLEIARMPRWLRAGPILLVLGLAMVGCATEGPKPAPTLIGRPAPEIEGVDQDGKPLKLSAYRGKVVLIDFWASWCPNCMVLIADDKKLLEEYKDRPFAIVGVNLDESPRVMKAVVADSEIPWPNWYDDDHGGPIARRWQASELPTIYLIDHKGIVQYEHKEVDNPGKLQREIKKLLKAAEDRGG
jgi:peroxiredoxin